MSPRRYDSAQRRVDSAATRTRILEATRAIIGGREDLDSFSMERVAEKAGVSRMTVYHQFGSRTGLLDGLADYLAERGGMNRLREAFLEPDVRAAIRRFVEVFVGFWASDRETLRRLRALAVVFPSKDRGPRERDSWRAAGAATLVARLRTSPRGLGRRGLSELSDVITALTSFETFDSLCSGRRGPGEVANLLTELVLAEAGLSEGSVPRAGKRSTPRRAGG